ncbi:aquaporin [Verrucosispora sp. WMMD573]|uniref:MIP/aquaporin family protein n=1 Tax=Verrucosispora sp. WMMD573 TaxID=3015149 RepID=UPI00248C4ADD|nr:aquaporin [Verrucosispora sp. WMMD573]WBB53383.1 aquaporin [Verrucosispora sp. WMMD573]
MVDVRRYVAECIGTFLLVFFGVGSAVAARIDGGVVVVSLAFGFVLLALVYTIGQLSGSHVNPAVTLGVLLSGKITALGAVLYWAAQFVGAAVASFLLWVLVRWGGVTDQTGVLGANGYGTNINAGGAMLLETVLTFLFVLVVLVVSKRSTDLSGFAGLAIGLALGVANLVGVALTGAAVNPARAFGPAIFEGGLALRQLWVFIVFPLLGAVLAALVAPLVEHGSGVTRIGTPRPSGR